MHAIYMSNTHSDVFTYTCVRTGAHERMHVPEIRAKLADLRIYRRDTEKLFERVCCLCVSVCVT